MTDTHLKVIVMKMKFNNLKRKITLNLNQVKHQI